MTIPLLYCNRLHAWWSTQSQLATTLLSSLIARRPVFNCWISFAPVVQFYLLLSPHLCFISFLYLDLYVLGDDALIS